MRNVHKINNTEGGKEKSQTPAPDKNTNPCPKTGLCCSSKFCSRNAVESVWIHYTDSLIGCLNIYSKWLDLDS